MSDELILVSAVYNRAELESHCWNHACGNGDVSGFHTVCGAPFVRCCQHDFTKCPLFISETFIDYDDNRAVFVRKLKVK